MVNIIIALPKLDDAKVIKNILVRGGFAVSTLATTGAMAISYADDLHDGIVICSYKLPDMVYSRLKVDLPPGFEMLLVASQRILSEVYNGDVVSLAMPLKPVDLINTVNMMAQQVERRRRKLKSRPTVRDPREEQLIKEAKELLMARNNMTETEAHRYLQKSSMDSGRNMVESAQMVILLNK